MLRCPLNPPTPATDTTAGMLSGSSQQAVARAVCAAPTPAVTAVTGHRYSPESLASPAMDPPAEQVVPENSRAPTISRAMLVGARPALVVRPRRPVPPVVCRSGTSEVPRVICSCSRPEASASTANTAAPEGAVVAADPTAS